jgi:HK97 family phage major capsid protein
MENIKSVLDAQAAAFEALKTANDARLKAIEEKAGQGDHLAKIEKINADLDQLADRLKSTEAALSRSAAAPAAAGADEQKAAFGQWLRRGDRAIDAVKGMRVSDNENGGYLVPESVVGPLIQRLFDGSPMRQVARIQSITGNAVEGVVSYGQLEVEWLDEISASSDPTTPTLKRYRIEVNNQRSSPRISPVLLEDGAVNVEQWLSESIARDFALSEQTSFITGSGVGRPRGITTYTTAATADSSRLWGQLEHVVTGTSGGFGSNANGIDKLIDLTGKLKSGYRAGAVWMMSKATLASARVLKTSSGDYIWQPSTQAGNPSVLLSYPVVEAEDMPTIAADSLSIAFGNFGNGYMVVDRLGLSVLRDPFSNNPYITFHATRRVGGGVVDFDAIKFLKFSA